MKYPTSIKPQWVKAIERLPEKDVPVLVWARWDWDDMGRTDEHYSVRVATYRQRYWDEQGLTCFVSVTSNPYCDVAKGDIMWMPLPEAPE